MLALGLPTTEQIDQRVPAFVRSLVSIRNCSSFGFLAFLKFAVCQGKRLPEMSVTRPVSFAEFGVSWQLPLQQNLQNRCDMVGQGSPIFPRSPARPRKVWRGVCCCRRVVVAATALVVCWLVCATGAHSAPTTVRLRFAWGGNAQAQQRWTGRIVVDHGTLTHLQSLGMEPDEPGSLRLVDGQLHIDPLGKRSFDGCDVTITAEPTAEVIIELQSDESTEPATARVPLSQLADEQFRLPLDEQNNFLLVHRAPGDQLAVSIERDSLVFDPGEQWQLQLHPNLSANIGQSEVSIEVRMHAQRSDSNLWEFRQTLRPGIHSRVASESRQTIPLTISCPAEEGVYRLTITASRPRGFASRFVPGKQLEELARRDVEFVVVDPAKKVKPLVDRWQRVLSLDPANPSWWNRLPSWAQLSRIPGMSPATPGNVRPVVRLHPMGELVELPPAVEGEQPSWQAYTLPVKQPGMPHLIEIKYPPAIAQQLAISIVEPDAAGNVLFSGQSAGMYTDALHAGSDTDLADHRIVFWPRTTSPLLLVVNRHPSLPAQFGRITLLQQEPTNLAEEQTVEDQTAETIAEETDSNADSNADAAPTRLVAAYVARPSFADNFGAVEILDPGSGLSVDSWATFLEGSTRLAQYLRFSGRNGALVSVAADGSALYPSEHLAPSPRYDTGMLASSAPDPMRKDVLELLLRIADRQSLRIIPTLQFANPLPKLEASRRNQNAQQTGVEWVGFDGRTWLESNPQSTGHGPHYNPLSEEVQAELAAVVSELVERYGHHASFAGVAIQLSGNGYSMLPGMQWGFDDQTVGTFVRQTGIQIAGHGQRRFRQRAEQLLGRHRDAWRAWRAERLTEFYRRLSQLLRSRRDDLQLVLTTEETFASPGAKRQLRLAVAGQAALDHVLLEQGIDLARLADVPGVQLLRSQRMSPAEPLGRHALDLRFNEAVEIDRALAESRNLGTLFYHLSEQVRLPSFDEQSPFGASRTHLSLTDRSVPAGAAARRQLVTSLARRDLQAVVDGGELLPLGNQAAMQTARRTFQQLPVADGKTVVETKTVVKQPLTVRIYRHGGATTVCIINEAPWPVDAELPLNCQGACAWKKLGAPSLSQDGENLSQDGENLSPSCGKLSDGRQSWPLQLQPYDLQAWRFESTELQLGAPVVRVSAVAARDLEQRIGAIQSRTGNLDIRRPYNQLLNPGFELAGDESEIVGWQPRIGRVGAVELDAVTKHSGNRALHLASADALGVAVQSNLFPMPETGQLILSLYVRSENIGEQTRLHIALEDDADGRNYRQFTTLGGEHPLAGEWSWYEFPVNDIPLDGGGPMRVQLYLTGPGEVWIDDVQLSDLQFAESQRIDLVKRVNAARRALDEGQVMDCLRLVDDYWPRYLVEHVPPALAPHLSTAKSPKKSQPQEATEENQGFGDRLKGIIPKFWR